MTIWIVVVDKVPYVRSVRGAKGRWYRELTARNEGAHQTWNALVAELAAQRRFGHRVVIPEQRDDPSADAAIARGERRLPAGSGRDRAPATAARVSDRACVAPRRA